MQIVAEPRLRKRTRPRGDLLAAATPKIERLVGSDRLLLLIHDFQAGVREALALFQEHRGLDASAVMCRRQEGLPPTGHIDPAGEIPYYFHGIGCCVDLPSGAVDWDFGHGGRIDGFDGWRLARFAAERAGEYPEFVDWRRVTALLQEAEHEGWIERFPEREHDTLYYLRASGDIAAQQDAPGDVRPGIAPA